jgi:hypothetical protein
MTTQHNISKAGFDVSTKRDELLKPVGTKPTITQANKLFHAISEMEKACLSDDSERTTVDHIIAQPIEETRDYFRWLKQQAPVTGMFYDFDTMAKLSL